MRRLLLLVLLAGCTAGRASTSGPDLSSEPDRARADVLAYGEDALWSRPASPAADSPWDDPEPLDFDAAVGEDEEAELVLFDEEPARDDVTPGAGVGAWPPPSAEELDALHRAGIAQVRVLLPYRAELDYAAPDAEYVAAIDGLFADAARAEITLVPVLASTDSVPEVTDDALTRWGDFCFWAAHRYGNEGELWYERDDLPYHPAAAWEVWSEPNHPAFWPGAEVSVDRYRALLLYARVGLRDGDPEARVVVGGLAPVTIADAMAPDAFLRALLDAPDARTMFDAVALHPYADRVEDALDEIARVHAELAARELEHVPVWLTEVGWALEDAPDCTAREGERCAGHDRFAVPDEATRAERLRALLDGIEAHPEWEVGPIFWRSWRDLSIDETGGVETWARHTGAFERDGSPRPAGDVLLGMHTVELPIRREAPGRVGHPRSRIAEREAARDEGPERVRRRQRKRAFRRVVIGRMYQLGSCVRDGHMRDDCHPWTLPAADRTDVDRYPDLEERRAAYVCRALRRLRPTYVSGLVRYNYDDVRFGDAGVQAEIESQARVFDLVRRCVSHGRPRVRFDVVLSALNYSHEGEGVTSASVGKERHRWMLDRLTELFHPDAWFYDFYSNPFEPGARTERSCYGGDERCGLFHPDGMRAGIGWAHAHGQWIGGNTFRGEGIPDGTDFVALREVGSMQQLARTRDLARRGRPDLPILMHVRNDPQANCSEGLAFLYRGEAYRRRVLVRHVRAQDEIGYAYMFPAFFPMRFDREDPRPDPAPCEGERHESYGELGRIRGMRAYDADHDGTLGWMRWQLDHRRAHP